MSIALPLAASWAKTEGFLGIYSEIIVGNFTQYRKLGNKLANRALDSCLAICLKGRKILDCVRCQSVAGARYTSYFECSKMHLFTWTR